jgi:hypothetical protein
MPNESTLLVPLRSNASTLLTGRPIVAMRQRLKYASLLHDHVLLEDDMLRLQAGPGGSWAVVEPVKPQDHVRWQTPKQRHASQAEPFQVSIAPESSPGVPSGPFMPAMASKGEVSWCATLRPFADEFPRGTDWVTFVRTFDPDGQVGRAASEWTWADERNSALEDAMPGRFVRGVVIKNANRDLAIAAASGLGVMADPLHMQVIIQRFNDEKGWRLGG